MFTETHFQVLLEPVFKLLAPLRGELYYPELGGTAKKASLFFLWPRNRGDEAPPAATEEPEAARMKGTGQQGPPKRETNKQQK